MPSQKLFKIQINCFLYDKTIDLEKKQDKKKWICEIQANENQLSFGPVM